MVQPISPSVPPAPPKKKGLSALAWVGIGCGCLVLATVIAFAVGGAFLVHKAKSFLGQAAEDPNFAARKAAEMVVRLNPDLEIVSTDDGAGTMTVRDRTSGEELTLSFDEIRDGKFSITKKGGERVGIDAAQSGEGAEVRVEGAQGSSSVFAIGGADSKLPAWVPLYPGAAFKGQGSLTIANAQSGTFSLRSDDAATALIDFYRGQMEELGLEIQTVSADGPNAKGTVLIGTGKGRSLTVTVGTDQGQSTALVVYGEKP